MTSDTKNLECSFCNKKQNEVKKLIAGPGVYICDECVELCHEVLSKDKDNKSVEGRKEGKKTPEPTEIYNHLSQYVIGQEWAKMVVSVAVSNHYKRLENPVIDDVELKKANICLIGPTGSGKTLIAETLATFLDVPLALADATSLTEAGYVGDDVETIVTRLLQVANYDKEKAERGIIFIDEIDKKSRRSDNASITRDVSGEGVQQSLLKMIEGDVVRVPPQGGRKNPSQEMIEVNTKNILFVVGGAFVGLDRIVENRINKDKTAMGFGAEIKAKDQIQLGEALKKIEPEDLIKFGLIPELVGRIPVVAALEELTEEQLIQVMVEPKNAITKQYQKLFELSKMQIEFTPEALKMIAKKAIERKTGARGIQGIIESKLIKTQFELSKIQSQGKKKVIVNDRVIDSDHEPEAV